MKLSLLLRSLGWSKVRWLGKTHFVQLASAMLLALSWAPPSWSQAGGDAKEWANVVAAAKKEGKVVWYTAASVPVSTRLVDGFKKAYPDVAVEFVRAASGELLSRLQQERTGGVDGADVFMSTEYSWYVDRAKEGSLLKLNGPAMAGWPGKYITDGAVVAGGFEPIVIPYNTKLVSKPPAGYADLLRPEFKGKIGNTELASTLVLAWFDWLEKGQGPDYLNKLKAQGAKLYLAAPQIAQAVASGEIAVGTFVVPSFIKPLQAQGAPIDLVVPNPALGYAYFISAVGWSKRPNAARLFTEYLMSREGQIVWHGRGESSSPLSGIPGSLQSSNVVLWNPAAYPPDVVAKYTQYWNKIFK